MYELYLFLQVHLSFLKGFCEMKEREREREREGKERKEERKGEMKTTVLEQ